MKKRKKRMKNETKSSQNEKRPSLKKQICFVEKIWNKTEQFQFHLFPFFSFCLWKTLKKKEKTDKNEFQFELKKKKEKSSVKETCCINLECQKIEKN